MYQNMTYINYSLLNKNMQYSELPGIKSKPDIQQVFQKIAYINIEKVARKSISYDKELLASFHVWEDILEKQIAMCDADILIFGGTFKYFRKMINIADCNFEQSDYCRYAKINKKIYIDAKHPAKVIGEGEYPADIINILRKVQ